MARRRAVAVGAIGPIGRGQYSIRRVTGIQRLTASGDLGGSKLGKRQIKQRTESSPGQRGSAA